MTTICLLCRGNDIEGHSKLKRPIVTVHVHCAEVRMLIEWGAVVNIICEVTLTVRSLDPNYVQMSQLYFRTEQTYYEHHRQLRV